MSQTIIEVYREAGEHDSGSFTVRVGDRYADQLCWDEMLAQVVHLTHPGLGDMRERFPMLTAQQHDDRRRTWAEKRAQQSARLSDGEEGA